MLLKTQSIKIFISAFLILLSIFYNHKVFSQSGSCSTDIKFFDVDLSTDPSGTYTSPSFSRSGTCCGFDTNDRCAEFNIKLHPLAEGINFEIISGPVPSGAMAYRMDCDLTKDPIPVGTPICVYGNETHTIFICMPGNAQSQFRITSIVSYYPVEDFSVTKGCTATLTAPAAFNPGSVTYEDITGGGIYNKYLSCVTGCSNTEVTPDDEAPAFVDYRICGTANGSTCGSVPYCDVVRIFFEPTVEVSINPSPAILCPGSSGVLLSGSVTGGSEGSNTYIWTNSIGDVVGNSLNYTAVATGNYTLEVRNENFPKCIPFTASVNVYDNLAVNAGEDQQICVTDQAQLNGNVTAATGGEWSGGNGTFSPDKFALNALYTPSSAEISAGSVTLTLTTTGNENCTAISDDVIISFYTPLVVSINAPPILCNNETGSITVTASAGSGSYSYLWDTGETSQTIIKQAGTYSVIVTDNSTSCTSNQSVTITNETGPSQVVATTTSSICGNSNGIITISSVTGGTSPYTYSINGTTFQTSTTFSELEANNYTITVRDSNTCTISTSVSITNIAGPTEVSALASSSTCGNNNGSITVSSVTGGTSPYTYSIDGSTFQSSNIFSGLAATNYTLTVSDANSCTTTTSVIINNIDGPSDFAMSLTPASCKNNDGSIIVNSVTGGTSPYAYSTDGINYSSSNTFSNLSSGDYIVRIRDVNNCVISKTATVEVSFPTKVNATTVPSTCGLNNGSIDVSFVEGGMSPYMYSLDGINFQSSTSFSGLTAGNFTVTAKDINDCKTSANVTISNIPGPSSVSATTTSSTCNNNNGRITISEVTGGTGPYTYSINGITFQNSMSFVGLAASTYTVTARDANYCLITTSAIVSNIPGPSDLSTTTMSSTCGSNNGSILITGVSGGTAPYTYSINGGSYQNSENFIGLIAAIHNVSVKDANGCIFTKSIAVNDVSGPNDIQTSTKAATCGATDGEINIISVSGGTANFNYSLDGTTYQSETLFSNLPASIHNVYVQDANGCIYQKEVTILNDGGPSAFTSTITSATCENNDGAIEVTTVTGGDFPYTYSIDENPFQSSGLFSDLKAGNYNISVKDAKNCVFESNVTVPSTGPYALSLSSTPSTCGTNNGKIEVLGVTGGTASYSYSLDGINFQAGTEFSSLSATEYEVTVKDNAGCLFSNSIVISNIPGPDEMVVEVLNATCGLANGSIMVTSVDGGTAPYEYSIDGINFQSDHNFTNLSEGSYDIVVKDANNCTFLKSILIQNIPGPSSATADTRPATCDDSNGQIEVITVIDGTSPYSYSINNIHFQSGNIFNNVAEGNYTVTVKDANSCLVTTVVSVGNIAGPSDVELSTVLPHCGQNDGEILIGTVSGGTAPFTYSLDGNSFIASPELKELYAGSYTLYVKDQNNCIFEKEINLHNLSGPTAIIASTTPATCDNNDGSFTITTVEGGTGPYEFAINESQYQSSDLFSNLSGGSYLLKVKDQNGCIFEDHVFVGSTGPYDADVITTFSSCKSSDGTVTINNVAGGVSPYLYSINGTDFQASITFTELDAGNYNLTVKDANNCTFNTNFSIYNNGPTIIPEDIRQISCFGASDGMIHVTTEGGNGLVKLSKDGINYQDDGIFQNLSPGTYTIYAKDDQDCINSISFQPIIEPDTLSGALVILQSPEKNKNNGIISLTNFSGGTYPYNYTINNVESSDTIFYNLSPEEHIVMMYDANGCSKEYKINLSEIISELEIPNGFTPNGDGRNDLWEIKNLNILFPDCEVLVFNRWGSMMYYSRGYGMPWDGSRNGNLVPAATYYYIIKIPGNDKAFKGAVTIIR